jgi:hypothetical protein
MPLNKAGHFLSWVVQHPEHAPHALNRRVASQHNEVSPGEGIAILVLDAYQNGPALVQIGLHTKTGGARDCMVRY